MRKRIPSSLKVQVAIEALKGLRSLNEIASEYEVQPNPGLSVEKAISGEC